MGNKAERNRRAESQQKKQLKLLSLPIYRFYQWASSGKTTRLEYMTKGAESFVQVKTDSQSMEYQTYLVSIWEDLSLSKSRLLAEELARNKTYFLIELEDVGEFQEYVDQLTMQEN